MTKFIAISKIHFKYQLLIIGREKVGIKELKIAKELFDDIYENLEYSNPTKKGKVLITLDDMVWKIWKLIKN